MVSRICAGHRDKARGMGDLVLPDWLAGAEFVLQMEAQASKCDHNEKIQITGVCNTQNLGARGTGWGMLEQLESGNLRISEMQKMGIIAPAP